MNFLNQFRSKKHADAYKYTKITEEKAKFRYKLILSSYFIIGGILLAALNNDITAGLIDTLLIAIGLLLRAITYKVIDKYFRHRVKLIRFLVILSSIIAFLCITGFMIESIISIDPIEWDIESLIHIAFWWGAFVSLLNAVNSNWFIKTLQIWAAGLIMIFHFKDRIAIYQKVFGNLGLMLLSFFLYYSEDRYYKHAFLAKYRADQQAYCLGTIIEDICEGVIIYNKRTKKVLYTNQSVNELHFWQSDQTLEQNLERVKITRASKHIARSTDLSSSSSGISFAARRSSLAKGMMREVFLETENLAEFFRNLCASARPDSRRVRYLLEVKYNFKTPEISEEYSYNIQMLNTNYDGESAWAFIIRDTTERDTIITLQDNNEYKTRLLASGSHELRTPLNCSITFTEKALENEHTPENVKNSYLRPSLNSCKLLLSLINDFLDFSQMKAKKLRLVTERKSVTETVKDCVNLLTLQAEKKGIYIKVVGLKSLKSTILNTDHNRLRQILLNLLSNAMKFTYEGGITLALEERIRKEKDDITGETRENRTISFSVADTGIGIKPEDQVKLFRAFEKIDLGDQKSINASGVGLGLVISNDLAKSLGPNGREKPIEIKSEFGVGTTFEFEILDQKVSTPCIEVLPSTNIKSGELENSLDRDLEVNEEGDIRISFQNYSFLKLHEPKSALGLTKRKGSQNSLIPESFVNSLTSVSRCSCSAVMIADDDMFNIAALESILHSIHISTVSAFNGKIAVDKFLQRESTKCGPHCRPFSLIFMDCNMPLVDGYEASRSLKSMMKKKEVRECPIIACTALVQPAETEKCREYGMDECIEKPLDPKTVIRLLKKYGAI